MKTTPSLEAGELRLLETDNKVMLPIDTRIRIIATGADVIHSWAVPSLGVKIDAIPGKNGAEYPFIYYMPGCDNYVRN